MKSNFQHHEREIPVYIRYFYILTALALTSYILILAQSVFKPLLAALIVGLLLKPMSSLMERVRIPRALSSVLSILVVFIILTGLSIFFSAQISNIASYLDQIEERISTMIDKGHNWAEDQFGIEPERQTSYLKDSMSNLMKNSSSFFGSTISATAGFFSGFFLFLIALFFFLYYRSFLVSFLYKVFKRPTHNRLKTTLHKVENVVRQYILGLFLVIIIIAVLNTVGLLALGIEHAIFFGVMAAILTIIPYIGILIGALLPALFALVTHDSLWYPVGVILVFWFVQFLEGNFITPNIIGSQVSINPFAAILGLFVGGMMFGALGMILAIPALAIIKVICDSIDSTKPIGYLIGSPPSEKELSRQRGARFRQLLRKRQPVDTSPSKD